MKYQISPCEGKLIFGRDGWWIQTIDILSWTEGAFGQIYRQKTAVALFIYFRMTHTLLKVWPNTSFSQANCLTLIQCALRGKLDSNIECLNVVNMYTF